MVQEHELLRVRIEVQLSRQVRHAVDSSIVPHQRHRYDQRDELHGTIADYHRGLVPLIVPLTLLRHYVGKFALDYLRDQVYLDPHPKELMLLNHV